jgi:hypothetical protein
VGIGFEGLLIRAAGDMRNFRLAPTVHLAEKTWGDFHQDLGLFPSTRRRFVIA